MDKYPHHDPGMLMERLLLLAALLKDITVLRKILVEHSV